MFALFEYINLRLAKSTFEPQRYHYVTFEHLHTLLTSGENNQIDNATGKDSKKKGAKGGKKNKKTKKDDSDSDADALSLAKNLNDAKAQSSSSSSESDSSDSEAASDSDSDLSNASLSKSERIRRKEKRREKKDAKKMYTQVKHVFSVDIKELKNIPILTKFIKEARDYESAQIFKSSSATSSLNRLAHSNNISKEEDVVDSDRETDYASSAYIQNVAVKYSFPLDEDEILESDYIKRVTADQTSQGSFDYAVSMNSVHTYLMPKEDQIKDLLAAEQSQAAAKSAN